VVAFPPFGVSVSFILGVLGFGIWVCVPFSSQTQSALLCLCV
jgi:hypothetical protein